MNEYTKEMAKEIIEKYFFGQQNNELVIKEHDMGNFLKEFSELVISRTLDIAFNMKE